MDDYAPGSNCCRCFAPNPKNWFTRVMKGYQMGIRLKHTMPVPLCDRCFRYAWMRRVLQLTASYGGAFLMLVVVSGIISFSEARDGALSVGGIILIGIVATVIAFGVAFALFLLLAGPDYMTVTLRGNHQVKVAFANAAYQALYQQAIPPEARPVKRKTNTTSGAFDDFRER